MTNHLRSQLLLVFCYFAFGSNVAVAESAVADAAARDSLAEVRELLRGGADVNSAHGDGMTALHWAAENGNAEMANALLYAGSNLSAGTRIGQYTPLHIAARNGSAAVVRELLDAGADPGVLTNNSGVTALHLAAANGNTNVIDALLAAGATVDVRESARGQTPLIFASAYNRVAAIKTLIAAGADVSLTANVIDTFDREKADKAADDRIEEFLAEFKAKEGGGVNWQPQPSQVQAAIEASREIQRKWPNVPDPSCDDDAEGCAVAVTYNADGEPVYNHGADEEAEKEEKRKTYGQRVGQWGGLTALLHAVRQGHSEATLTLLDSGADVNQVSAGDRTSPLLMASINGQFDLALLLLERGADPNLTSLAGTTPLFAVLERQWASRASYAHPTEHQQQQASHLETMQALLDAGADPNMRLNSHLWFAEYTFSLLSGQAGLHYKGATPFWRAALALDVDAMRMLKAHGADTGIATVKLPERRRRTPPPDQSEIETADAKIAETGEAATTPENEEDKDQSGLPEVPVGGDFVSPIHLAAGAGYGQWFAGNAHQYAADSWLPTIRFLVEQCGADVNLRDANGYSPLHHAASRGDNKVVQYLIDQGADVMVVSRKGQTVVDMANGPIQRLSPFPETIALLESYGAINNHNCVSC